MRNQYDVSITADGYVEEEFEFEVEENKNYSGEQFVISPSLAEGHRAYCPLSGESGTGRDLDSYLKERQDSGTDVSVSFSDKTCSSGSETIAELDVDDTTGYGPRDDYTVRSKWRIPIYSKRLPKNRNFAAVRSYC